MLHFMRKNAKSWALRIMLGLIALTFILWGVGGIFSGEERSAVITVDGTAIPNDEYQRTFSRLVESYRSVMGASLDTKAIEDLKIRESAADYLVERALMEKTAQDLCLTVGAGEIRSFIEKEPAFSDKGGFSAQRYRDFLSTNRLTREGFEASLAADMTLAKVRSLVRASAVVTPQEIDEILDMSARKVDIELARLDPDRFVRQAPPPSSSEISAWFNDHREDYRRPESFSAVFAVIDPAHFKNKVVVSEDDLAGLYEEKRLELTEPARYKFSRIFFALPLSASNESIASIRSRADTVVKLVRDAKTPFAVAARKFSQDRASAAKGGDMGELPASAIEPATLTALDAAKEGKATDPVATARGLEILFLSAKTRGRNLTLAEAKGRLTAEIVSRVALELANDAANQILTRAAKEKVPLADAARILGAEVFTPPVFTRKIPPEVPGIPRQILPDLYQKENREIGDVYEQDGKLWLYQMIKRTDSYLAGLEEAKAEVEATLLVQKALEMTGKEGERLAKEIGPGSPLAKVAARVQAKVTTPPAFSILEKKVGDLPESDSSAVIRAAFSIAKTGEAALARGKGAFYLVGLKRELPVEPGQKLALREQVTQLLRNQRGQDISSGYFKSLREEMKDRIKINKDML